MAFTPAFTLLGLKSGATVPSSTRTLAIVPHQQRLAIPLPELSTSIPHVNVGDPTGDSVPNLIDGVPRRATWFKNRNDLIPVGHSRLAEGIFV